MEYTKTTEPNPECARLTENITTKAFAESVKSSSLSLSTRTDAKTPKSQYPSLLLTGL